MPNLYRFSENIPAFISVGRYGRLLRIPMAQVWIPAIRRLMANKGWGQVDLAKEGKLRPNTLSDVMNGVDTRISTLEKIAKGLEVPLWALFVEEHEYGVVKQQLEKAAEETAEARQERQLRTIVEPHLPQMMQMFATALSKQIADGTLTAPEAPLPKPVTKPEPVTKTKGKKSA